MTEDDQAGTGDQGPRRRVVANSGDLARRLSWEARTTEDIERLTRRVSALEEAPTGGAGGDIAEQVAKLRADLDKLAKTQGEAPPPFHWADLEDEERDQRWTEMLAWVDDVFRVWHPMQAKALRSCWEQHPGVVAAVTAAWLAWLAAYRGESRRGSDPAVWIRDHLVTLTRHLKDETGGELEPSCPVGH